MKDTSQCPQSGAREVQKSALERELPGSGEKG